MEDKLNMKKRSMIEKKFFLGGSKTEEKNAQANSEFLLSQSLALSNFEEKKQEKIKEKETRIDKAVNEELKIEKLSLSKNNEDIKKAIKLQKEKEKELKLQGKQKTKEEKFQAKRIKRKEKEKEELQKKLDEMVSKPKSRTESKNFFLSLRRKKKPVLVPKLVTDCILEIEERGLEVEGIFRVSGSLAQIKILKKAYQRDRATIKLSTIDIHTVASLLKSYFNDLDVPLLTFELYDQFLSIAELPNESKTKKFKELLLLLPENNRETLRKLLEFLVKVNNNSDKNKMDAVNLASMFTNLLRNPTGTPQAILQDSPRVILVLQSLIQKFPEISASSRFEASWHRSNSISDFSKIRKSPEGVQKVEEKRATIYNSYPLDQDNSKQEDNLKPHFRVPSSRPQSLDIRLFRRGPLSELEPEKEEELPFESKNEGAKEKTLIPKFPLEQSANLSSLTEQETSVPPKESQKTSAFQETPENDLSNAPIPPKPFSLKEEAEKKVSHHHHHKSYKHRDKKEKKEKKHKKEKKEKKDKKEKKEKKGKKLSRYHYDNDLSIDSTSSSIEPHHPLSIRSNSLPETSKAQEYFELFGFAEEEEDDSRQHPKKKEKSFTPKEKFSTELIEINYPFVDPLLRKIIIYLAQNGINTVGIFSNQVEQSEVEEFLKKGEDVQLEQYDINVVASAFKEWILRQNSSLLSSQPEMYEDFLSAIEIDSSSRGWFLREIIETVEETFHAIKMIIVLLSTIAGNSKVNKMGTRKLGKIFAPLLLNNCLTTTERNAEKEAKTVTTLIKECSAIFEAS